MSLSSRNGVFPMSTSCSLLKQPQAHFVWDSHSPKKLNPSEFLRVQFSAHSFFQYVYINIHIPSWPHYNLFWRTASAICWWHSTIHMLSPANLSESIKCLECCLLRLHEWFCLNGLALNPDKSILSYLGKHSPSAVVHYSLIHPSMLLVLMCSSPIRSKHLALSWTTDWPLILMSPLFVHHVSSSSVVFNTFGPISRKIWQSRLQSLQFLHASIIVTLSCMAPLRLIFINCRGFRMSLPNWSVMVMFARTMLSAVYIGSPSINA